MRRLLLFLSLLIASVSVSEAGAELKTSLDSVQNALQSGPDSDFHKAGGASDTFAAALKNPFVGGNSSEDNSTLRMIVFFSVLTLAIFLRIWKNSMDRRERESQT